MTEISAALVKELRDLTGAGMMDCKRALVETGGDLEQARQLLREQGLAEAGKRAGRETTEGKVLAHVRDGRGAIVAVACETEPVSNNEEFLAFARNVLELVEVEGPEAAERLEEERVELVAKLGENIVVRGGGALRGRQRRGRRRLRPSSGEQARRARARAGDARARAARRHAHRRLEAGVRLARRGSSRRGRRGARDLREASRRSLETGAVRPRIVEGMLEKRFFAEAVLVDQPWIHDPDQTVGTGARRARRGRARVRALRRGGMSVARLRLAPVGETVFPPRAPFFDSVREPPGSLTHPPRAHGPKVGQ